MCPACAVRRAYKQQLKFISILDSDADLRDLDWYYIVLPVKHNKSESYETVFNRLNGLKTKINMAIRNAKREKEIISFLISLGVCPLLKLHIPKMVGTFT